MFLKEPSPLLDFLGGCNSVFSFQVTVSWTWMPHLTVLLHQSSPCNFWLVHSSLHWCAICQEHREMKGRLPTQERATPATIINPPLVQEMSMAEIPPFQHGAGEWSTKDWTWQRWGRTSVERQQSAYKMHASVAGGVELNLFKSSRLLGSKFFG